MRAFAQLSAALLHLTLLLGLVSHSIPGGRVLGRYSLGYAGGLALLAAMLPLSIKLAGFLVSVTRFTAQTGEEAVLRPRDKLKVALPLVLVPLLGLELGLLHQDLARSDKELAKFHPSLQIRGRPDRRSLHTNNEGFRGDPIQLAKTPGVTRIFVMGGSTVYCMRSAFEQTHVRLLERALAARFPERRYEVQNLGLDWYTTQHTLSNYLFRAKDFKPDIVILYHAINDLCRSFSPGRLAWGSARRDYSHYFGPIARIALGSRRYGTLPQPRIAALLTSDLLFSDLRRPRPRQVEAFASLAPFTRNLDSLARIIPADGVKLVLATQGSLYREDLNAAEQGTLWMNAQLCEQDGAYPDLPSMAKGMALFNDATRRVAGRHSIPLVDLARALPKDLEHFLDDCHTTPKSNSRIAELILEGLLQHGVIEPN